MLRVIDIETTSTDPNDGAIIEIASVDMVKGGGITNPMQTFVRPGRPIPSVASAIHHIVDADVEHAPTLEEAVERFRGADAYIAHKADFEKSFLAANGVNYAPWICTLKCALRAWPDLESHSNQALRYQLGIIAPFGYAREQISPHRAASDVIITAAIFEKLLEAARWSELVAWSSQPELYTKLHFGKYRGQRYDAVDPTYLDWLLRQQDMDAGVKFSAQHWISQREPALAS
jgi:exodeoxyribonuclease X